MKADSSFVLTFSDGTPYKQPGKILIIDRGVDNQSATIKVRIQFPNPKKQLISGMSVVLKALNTQSGNHVVVPYKAITEQMGEFFVFVSQDTIAVQHKVTIGPRVGNKIVILKGVEAGDKIVTEGIGRLRDKAISLQGLQKKPQTGNNQPLNNLRS